MLSPTRATESESEPKTLRIGQLANLAGVSVETLRFYEREGLLVRPYQHLSGYRAYPPAAVETVQTIRRAQALGFKLAEIKDLLQESRAGGVSHRAVQKLEEIDANIARLVSARQELARVVEYRCDRLIGCSCGRADCPTKAGSQLEDPAPVGPPGTGLLAGSVAAAACAACCAPLAGGLLATLGVPAAALGGGLEIGAAAAVATATGLGFMLFRNRRKRHAELETSASE